MNRIFFILFILLPCIAHAQPSGYTEGTRVEWTYNGRSHTYFRASGWSMSNGVVIHFFRGDGETSTSDTAHTLSKWISDTGPNWDGTITLPDNSKKKVLILEINNTSSANYDLYENDITYFFNNHSSPSIDTSQHDKFLISGLSGGCKRAMALLCNYYGNSLSYDFPYRHIYGHAAFMSTPDNSIFSFSTLNHSIKFWWIVGSADAGLTAPVHSSNSNDFCISVGNQSRYTVQTGGDHSDNVWDNWEDTTTFGKTVDEKIMVWAFAPSVTMNKITGINWRDLVNMAGGFNPWTMFDEQANIDPANGDISPVPTTMSLPTGKNLYSIYQNSESRFYVKLRGNFDLTGIDIHALSTGTYFGDTIVVYKGLHTPEDPLTAADRIATIFISAGAAGWVLTPVSGANAQDVSIITFGIKGNPDATPGFETIATRPDITEIVLYGDLDGSRSAALPATLTYAHRPNLTFKEKVGINNGSGYIDTRTIPDGTKMRSLIDVQFIPGNNQAWPTNTWNQNPFGDYPSLIYRTERYYYDSLTRVKGGLVAPEFFHALTRVQAQGCGSEYWGIDSCGGNPDLPASYKLKSDLGWHYANMYGSIGIASDTLNYKTYGVPKYFAQNAIRKIGYNNESDYLSRKTDTASDKDFKYYSVYQTAIEGSMFWDGHVAAYGPRLGVKPADSTIGIIGPGTIGLLGGRYHDLVTLIKDIRSDGKNFIKYPAAHLYPNNEELGVVPPYGIHPVEYGLRQKLTAWADTMAIVDSSMHPIWTEGGYDANDTLNGGNRSQYAVTDTSALTTREKQANLSAYNFFAAWMSPVEEYDEFELFNNVPETNNGSYQTSQDARSLPSLTIMPKLNFKKQIINIMGDYTGDSVLSETWRVSMVYRGHNKNSPQLKCYVVAKPNNGGLTGNITVNVGTGKTVTRYDMDYYSTTPVTSSLSVDGSGNVTVAAADKPVILIVSDNNSNFIRLGRRFRVVVNN